MKIYILSKGEYEDKSIIGIYDNWSCAYDVVQLDEHYCIEIWDLETNVFLQLCWITDSTYMTFSFEYRQEYSRDIDPTEVQR